MYGAKQPRQRHLHLDALPLIGTETNQEHTYSNPFAEIRSYTTKPWQPRTYLLPIELSPSLDVPYYNLAAAFYHFGLFELSDRAALAGRHRFDDGARIGIGGNVYRLERADGKIDWQRSG